MRETGAVPGLPRVFSMTFYWKKFLYCIPPALIAVPLGARLSVGLRGTTLLEVLFFCIALWTTGAVPKWLTSLFLLASFSMVSAVPIKMIFQFPLSDNFVMILLSFLFSQGLQNSQIFHTLIPVLQKKIRGTFSLAFSIFLCSLAMIWFVPQPFARIIIILQLYQTLFKSWNLSEKTCQVLCFNIINSSIFINCAFLRGDIILNNALVNISGIPITESIWMAWMLLPTLVFYIAGMALFYQVFRTDLKETAKLTVNGTIPDFSSDRGFPFPAALICGAAVLLWLTEPWTGISATGTILAADIIMALFGYLALKDLTCIDFELMIFLSAAFSIGPVMKESGIAPKLFAILLPLLPKTPDVGFMITLILVSIILHSMLGSCVTALSVMIPSITLLCQDEISVLPIMFLSFLSITCQYLLPLHNVSVMVGAGKGGYSEHTVLRWGVALTCYILLAFPLFYSGYWLLTGRL